MARRGIVIEEALYQRIRQAALEAGAERGEHVTISEWIREACREKLEREGAA